MKFLSFAVFCLAVSFGFSPSRFVTINGIGSLGLNTKYIDTTSEFRLIVIDTTYSIESYRFTMAPLNDSAKTTTVNGNILPETAVKWLREAHRGDRILLDQIEARSAYGITNLLAPTMYEIH